MLENLRKYNNLGDPAYFFELFQILHKGSWTKENIFEHFKNRIINNKRIFDGCMVLLTATEVVSINEDLSVKLAYSLKKVTNDKQLLKKYLLEKILTSFKNFSDIYRIFSVEHLSKDKTYKTIKLSNAAFGNKYASVRNLFIDFGLIERHPDLRGFFLINIDWKEFFEREFSSVIRKRKINIEEFKKREAQKELNGLLAEEFVLSYEKTRLGNRDGIEWVALLDVGAGFDIASFNDKKSKVNDRYIEVKSYVGNVPYFYWSENEIKVAKLTPDKYFLYLVNRDEIKKEGYSPRIIANPAANVLSHECWESTVTNTYYFSEIVG